MTPLEKIQTLKRKAEKAKQDAAYAEGALSQALARLKEEFGCSTLDEARSKLEALEREKDQMERDFERAWEVFEAKWKDYL